jgi:hypothetical protein
MYQGLLNFIVYYLFPEFMNEFYAHVSEITTIRKLMRTATVQNILDQIHAQKKILPFSILNGLGGGGG